MLEQDRIIKINIEEEMKSSYIDYSMSVIVSRALPDVRDGFKPVHRRILFGMMGLGNTSDKPYKKSARVVGEVLGKYHPHGDSSVYGALVRMAQPWAMRYMLVDGQGNYGSVDGDSAAAMRYTECRLRKIGEDMMTDLEKETVDMQNNFDDSLQEPTVMPARIPNLLVNGASGIAVGMATNMPTHNLSEVIDACIAYIENNDIDIEELMTYVKAPDFPTGGYIYGMSGVREAYLTGRGRVIMRARAEIETGSTHDKIVVTEIPYGVNKAELIKNIADLANEKKIEGIADIKDHSDRNGINITIECKKDYSAQIILNQLYKYSQLQETYSVNFLTIVDGVPRTLNLKEMLSYYLEFQEEVVTRRTQFDLDKALARMHIVEGLLKALDNIDEVINILRSSKTRDEAKTRLMDRFEFTEIQVNAICDMRLIRLIGLEREKLETEKNDLTAFIAEMRAILADKNKLITVIKNELIEIRDKYGDARRTRFVADMGEINYEDLIADDMSVITMTQMNYVKRIGLDTYRIQNRGGKGIKGMQTREEDVVTKLFLSSNHSYLLYFTDMGRVYRTKTYNIPEAGRTAKGTPVVNIIEKSPEEKISEIIPVKEFSDNEYLVMVTKNGVIKKTPASEYESIRKSGKIAITLKEGDELISIFKTTGNDNIFLATRNGMAICFNENDARAVGRTASGVKAIDLADGDYVVGAEPVREDSKVLLVTDGGYGKCTDLTSFRIQHRGGKGLKAYKITEKTGNIIGISMVNDSEELIMVTSEGVVIRIRIKDIATTTGRITQGVRLINLNDGVIVVSMDKISAEDTVEEESEENNTEVTAETTEE
mgnify:CR=1 FL=1